MRTTTDGWNHVTLTLDFTHVSSCALAKILCGFHIETDKLVLANQPDIVVVAK